MACKLQPKLSPEGRPLKWNPKEIPPTKPFVRIVTSASESPTTFEDMRFVKTRSLIYTAFHKEARYVNFEIGYPKSAKWLEFVTEKWTEYANFFVVGFFEEVYAAIENGVTTTYAQIDAKCIDYDIRFRNLNSSETQSKSPTTPLKNVFAQRRNNASLENSPKTPKPLVTRNDSVTMEENTSDSPNEDMTDDINSNEDTRID
jgi:hypothetical protein